MRRSGRRGASLPGGGVPGPAAGRLEGRGGPGSRRRTPTCPGARHRAVRRRVPPLLLAGGLADGPEAGAVPPAGHGGQVHRTGPPLAHGALAEVCRAARNCCGDALPGGGRTDPASQAEGVAWWESSRRGRRGDGGQAAGRSSPGGGACPSRP